MKITDDILYAGVNDREIDLFEGQYVVPNGMAYNSFVIVDEKIAVTDTVDRRFGKEWLENLARATGGSSTIFSFFHAARRTSLLLLPVRADCSSSRAFSSALSRTLKKTLRLLSAIRVTSRGFRDLPDKRICAHKSSAC